MGQALRLYPGGSAARSKTLPAVWSRRLRPRVRKGGPYRDRINAISRANDHQKVVFTRAEEQDIFALASTQEQSCVSVLSFRGERLVDKQDHLLGEVESQPHARTQFLLRYYSQSSDIPREVALDGPCEDVELVERS